MLHLFPFRCESFSHPHLHSPRLLLPVPWTCPLRREKQRANKERKAPRWCPDCWLKSTANFESKFLAEKSSARNYPNKEISAWKNTPLKWTRWLDPGKLVNWERRDPHCRNENETVDTGPPVRFWWNIEDLRGWWFGCTSTGRSFCGSHLGSVLFFPQHHSSPNDTHLVKIKIHHKFAP